MRIKNKILPVLAVLGLTTAIVVANVTHKEPPKPQPIAQPAQAPFTAYIGGGGVVEASSRNIAVGTSPRKWSGLLIAGNGATIDWTHAMGTQPSDGVELQISRALTSFDVASDTRTDIGTLLSTGHLGSGVVQLDYLTTVDLKGRLWKTGELVRVKKADATDAKGFPPALVSADPSATGWFIRCLSINDTRTVKEFEFTSESAGVIRAYKARLSGTTWSVAKVYTSLDKPTANDISALGMRAPVTGTDVVNLNDMYSPDYYGATAIKSTASAVAANNYPFDEVGTVLVLPFALVLLGWVIFRRFRTTAFTRFAMALAAGGFAGNLLDRILQGYVVDMIYFPWMPWYICNPADIAICLGVALLAVSLIWRPQDWMRKSEAKTRETDRTDRAD